MAIKFRCPHCQKQLTVRDHLAGKRAACPACKKVLAIPAPTAAPMDLENFAASALTDQAGTARSPTETRTLDFVCSFCEEQLHLSMDLAGKQTPCPKCRRIIKAPLPKKIDPKDWRKGDAHLPSGVRRDTEPAPEGAWGSTTSAGVVSREALLDADAIPEVRESLTLRQRIGRWTAVAVGLLIVVIGAWGGWGLWFRNRQGHAVDQALQGIAEHKTKELALSAAAVNLAAGKYALRSDSRDSAATANTRFRQARDLCLSFGPGQERDLLLIDLALAQIDLGSASAQEIQPGFRLSWRDALKGLSQTLQNLHSSETRLYGIQEVSRKLIAKGQALGAVSIATQLSATAQRNAAPESPSNKKAVSEEGPELLARVGLELLQANQKEQAKQIAEQAMKAYPEDAKHAKKKSSARPPIAPTLAALCVALDLPELKPGDAPGDPDNAVLGRVEGLTLRGRIDEARSVAAAIPSPMLRWKALVALAAVASAYDPPNFADLDGTVHLLDGELKDRVLSAWTLYQLAELALQAGQGDRAQHVAVMIGDSALRGHVQCDVMRHRLSQSTATADTTVMDAVDPHSLSHSVAHEVWARHNARYGGNTATTIATWDEKFRPFGYIGAALGMQDKTQ